MTSKKTLIGVFTIVLLLIAIAVLATGVLRQSRLDTSSREFAIHAIPIILSGNPRYEAQDDLEDAPDLETPPSAAEVFARFAHPQLLARQPLDDIGNYLHVVTLNLGQLQVVGSIRGGSEVPLFFFSQQAPSAAYQLQVEFRGGTAEVEVELLREQGEWLISEFSVESSLLAD